MTQATLRKGARTREAILDAALTEAASSGLSGLTFGRLAQAVGMSKSGLFAHFKSKEDLQLATLEEARQRYVDSVQRPTLSAPPGLPRLWARCQAWLSYAQNGVFGNGCFFSAVAVEFDNRPGAVRDTIAGLFATWIDELTQAVEQAQELGHVQPEVDARQVAFEINALMTAANAYHQLLGGHEPFARSWRAIRRRLQAVRVVGSPDLHGLCSDEQPALV
ncbi:MAG: TetR/AcrR family transcriptional regulator [Planctomycetes bacterium]|nr:TetR/AcrR family transcriptional regulator [Planctomycetota bacterium]